MAREIVLFQLHMKFGGLYWRGRFHLFPDSAHKSMNMM